MGWLPIQSHAAKPSCETSQHATPDTADTALVAAAQADPQAFVALYDRYVERIYAYCYARLGNRALAEDATSEVFTKALAALGRYTDRCFAAWLFRIAHNVVTDQHRRRPTTSLADQPDWPDPQPGPADAAIAQTEYAALQAALAALPAEQRAVIELPYAGWSSDELATLLARSPAAIKQLRYRAVQRLRALLTDAGYISEEAQNG